MLVSIPRVFDTITTILLCLIKIFIGETKCFIDCKVEYYYKFLTAIACQDISFSELLLHYISKLGQYLVTFDVPKGTLASGIAIGTTSPGTFA